MCQAVERMTIDELAREAGMTVRNVRAHQTRGLLPPPELHGRTGYYAGEHLARLRLIKDMQAAGYNLAAIKNLLDAAPPGTGEELLRFEQLLRAPWGGEEPEEMRAEELAEMMGTPSQEVVERAVDLGLLRWRDDGQIEVPMPTLLRAGRELRQLGVPPERMLATLEALLRHVQGVSATFVDLFLEGVWRPFEARGRPAEEWPRVREGLERLRPLASEALAATFHATMTAAVEEAFGREIGRDASAEEEAG